MLVPPKERPPMPDIAVVSSGRISPAIVAVTGFGVILLTAALALWSYHGTAVFYEMILAGLAACF
jgi:hypothetical protein